MAKLPVVSGRVFERAGWIFHRQRGSHMILTKSGVFANLSIPDHRELDRGLLRGLIRDAGMTTDEFEASVGRV
jgi:predicted RNA binding protein YcfA (HicA-like mRNA interferase family)